MTIARYVGGRDGMVIALREHSVDVLGYFSWGDQEQGSAKLAQALALDALGGDEAKALRYYRRLMHRTVTTWDKGKPWTITAAELNSELQSIMDVEKEAASMRAAVDRDKPQIVNEPPLKPSERQR